MRIIAGKYRSRKLKTLEGMSTRPTLDQTKEAIFSSLGGYIPDFKVLDVFGGSGALSLESISRGAQLAYIIDENRVVLSVKVIEGDEIIALLPIYLVGKKIGCIAVNYLEQIGSAITIVLTQCYNQNFNGAERLFGEYLQDKVIYSCFAKHIYQTDRVSFLISYLKKLCLLTFENKEFTTGFILTRSIFDFNKEKFHARGGTIYNLKQPQDIFKFIKPDRRLWYLVDGETSFFLTNQQFKITNIYTISSEKDARNYWDSYSLSKILCGNDIVFRVVNHNQISIVNSDGIEFIAIENSWKFRDYKVIKAIVQENSNLD